jgi:hypothetical protein
MRFQSDRHAANLDVRAQLAVVGASNQQHTRTDAINAGALGLPAKAPCGCRIQDAHAMTRTAVCWSPSGVELCIDCRRRVTLRGQLGSHSTHTR